MQMPFTGVTRSMDTADQLLRGQEEGAEVIRIPWEGVKRQTFDTTR